MSLRGIGIPKAVDFEIPLGNDAWTFGWEPKDEMLSATGAAPVEITKQIKTKPALLAEINGKVVAIADGDTVTVLMNNEQNNIYFCAY